LKKINIAIDGYSSCGKSTLARELAEKLGYTYIDAETTGTEEGFSRYALENLNHQVTAGVQLSFWRALDANIRYRYSDPANLDDFQLVDVRLQWLARNYSVFADATNVLDIRYRETNLVTMPGRWFQAGVSFIL